MRSGLRHAAPASSHGDAGAHTSGASPFSNRWFVYGIAFAVLHIVVAWAAFSVPTYDRGPEPAGADLAVESARSASGSEGIAHASASVSEAIDLLYADLPLRMSDSEWRRDLSTSCMLLSTRAGELEAMMSGDPEATQVIAVLQDMSGTADELRAAVERQDVEAARMAAERMNRSVEVWVVHAPAVGAE